MEEPKHRQFSMKDESLVKFLFIHSWQEAHEMSEKINLFTAKSDNKEKLKD